MKNARLKIRFSFPGGFTKRLDKFDQRLREALTELDELNDIICDPTHFVDSVKLLEGYIEIMRRARASQPKQSEEPPF